MPRTALHAAQTLEQLAAALQAGADVDAQDKYGRTAMMLACEYGGKHAAGMVRALVDAGADVDKQDIFGKNAPYAAGFPREHGAGMKRCPSTRAMWQAGRVRSDQHDARRDSKARAGGRVSAPRRGRTHKQVTSMDERAGCRRRRGGARRGRRRALPTRGGRGQAGRR